MVLVLNAREAESFVAWGLGLGADPWSEAGCQNSGQFSLIPTLAKTCQVFWRQASVTLLEPDNWNSSCCVRINFEVKK
jgi:hypothetical protein